MSDSESEYQSEPDGPREDPEKPAPPRWYPWDSPYQKYKEVHISEDNHDRKTRMAKKRAPKHFTFKDRVRAYLTIRKFFPCTSVRSNSPEF